MLGRFEIVQELLLVDGIDFGGKFNDDDAALFIDHVARSLPCLVLLREMHNDALESRFEEVMTKWRIVENTVVNLTRGLTTQIRFYGFVL